MQGGWGKGESMACGDHLSSVGPVQPQPCQEALWSGPRWAHVPLSVGLWATAVERAEPWLSSNSPSQSGPPERSLTHPEPGSTRFTFQTPRGLAAHANQDPDQFINLTRRHRNAIDVNEHRQGPAVGRERLPRGY
ncbi:hypothetical protein CB1_106914004 [Camelus ferus]|nr:hypothetical protein CB1_106914004 [Camelus ferus]